MCYNSSYSLVRLLFSTYMDIFLRVIVYCKSEYILLYYVLMVIKERDRSGKDSICSNW